jgi:fumarate reductase flavoprotein subunit
MGLGAGADIAGKNSYMAFTGGIPFFDTTYTGKSEPGPWFQYLRQGWLQLARGSGWLEVNSNCEEYLPDSARADYEMHPRATGATQGKYTYSIFDADYQKNIWETLPPPMLDDRPMTLEDPEYPWFDKFKDLAPKDWRESVKQALEMGGIKKADTIEELAEQLGLDPKKLAAAVKTWNSKSAAGKVDEFGRLPHNMKPILKAPFYGIKSGAVLGSTYCGVRVNYHFQVIGKDQDPIPGLYAAGLTAGGMNGEGMFQATALSSLGLALSTGWIAGDNATAPQTYVPKDMIIEYEVTEQRLLNKVNKYFPKLGGFVINTVFSMQKKKIKR